MMVEVLVEKLMSIKELHIPEMRKIPGSMAEGQAKDL